MAKKAVSVTLEESNLVWLKGRVGARRARSISELVDRLVSSARARGSSHDATSVVGTIDIADSDPKLLDADAAVRALYRSSLGRPLLVREAAPPAKRRARRG
jgi:hypothetical protein